MTVPNLVPSTRTWEGYAYCHHDQRVARYDYKCAWCSERIPFGDRYVRSLFALAARKPKRKVAEHCLRCWVLLCAADGWVHQPRAWHMKMSVKWSELVYKVMTQGRHQDWLHFDVEYDPAAPGVVGSVHSNKDWARELPRVAIP